MAIDPAKVVFWWPGDLKKFKEVLFARVAGDIVRNGGRVIKADHRRLEEIRDDEIPVVGCHPPLKYLIDSWRKSGRPFVYWDRGYCVRMFSTWLRRPGLNEGSGFYRWALNSFQMARILDVPDDRWKALRLDVKPWAKGGRHIVVAAPTPSYSALHGTERWTDDTVTALNKLTDRPIMVRSKESKRPLGEDLKGAHCLVTHGSNAANEAIIMGCPVTVDKTCAAALVGHTDLAKIETPTYPERQPWLNSMAYSQVSEDEMATGRVWKFVL